MLCYVGYVYVMLCRLCICNMLVSVLKSVNLI